MEIDNLSKVVSAVNGTDDREARSKFWIAVYTRPKSEKKAAAELGRLGIETYVPVQRQLRIWSDRKKYIEVPVIPMIFFAKVYEEEIKKIKLHHLIRQILSYPGEKRVASIPNWEINRLKQLLNQHEIPVEFEFGKFVTDDLVVITSGKLKGVTGMVKETNEDTTTIWITVDLLGGSIIRIHNSQIEKITKEVAIKS